MSTTDGESLQRPERPSVAVVIPTLNSARTLERCLRAIELQTVAPAEIFVVDSNSNDSTPEIASRSATLIQRDCGMTEARYIGAVASSSDLVLNVDSDQVLLPDAIERCLNTGRSVVALGETSVGRGLPAMLNRVDRDLVETSWMENLDPVRGPIRPRLYGRSLLIRALEAIPAGLRRHKPAPYSEDSLIYLNSGTGPDEVGYVPRAILHLEEETTAQYVRKWFGYGRSAKIYRGTPFEFLVWGRGGRVLRLRDRAVVYPALALKGVPFYLGYAL